MTPVHTEAGEHVLGGRQWVPSGRRVAGGEMRVSALMAGAGACECRGSLWNTGTGGDGR